MIARLFLALILLTLAGCGRGGPDEGILARALGLPADVGGICGFDDMLGRELADIGSGGACGIEDPVKVYAIGGVKLDSQPRINCRTATALRSWVTGPAQDAARDAGVLVTDLRVVAGYACRRRNNRPSGRLSEHAKGNAVDIAAFTLSDGAVVTVSDDWSGSDYSGLMRAFHRTACGPFGTVLGPKSDRFHQDHFHFDTAEYRSGPYCK
ncbi:MAG: extensin family protein [Pseudomonadota bacterium]